MMRSLSPDRTEGGVDYRRGSRFKCQFISESEAAVVLLRIYRRVWSHHRAVWEYSDVKHYYVVSNEDVVRSHALLSGWGDVRFYIDNRQRAMTMLRVYVGIVPSQLKDD